MINLLRLFMITVICLPCFAHDNVTQLIPKKDLLTYEKSADTWIANYATQLSPEELQLLANMLYLSHQFGKIDSAVRYQAKIVLQLSSHVYIRAMASQYDDQVTEYLAALVHTFKKSSQLHQSLLLKWKACTDSVDTFKDSQLEKAIIAFQEQAIEAMAQYMQTNAQELSKIFTTKITVLEESNASIKDIAQAYTQLTTTRNKTANQNYQNNYIHLDIATKLAAKVTQIAQNLVESTEPVFEHADILQAIGTILFELYYSKLYTWMQTHNQQPMILFDENGLIEEQKRDTFLPTIQ